MATGCFGNFKYLVLDEIALEGLQGVTINSLWINLSVRLKCELPLNDKITKTAWGYIKASEERLQFFELPMEINDKEIFNRFRDLDEGLGVPIVQERTEVNQQKFVPIENENDVWGSCENYDERKLISFDEIKNIEWQQAIDRWGRRLVIVAKQRHRIQALLPPNVLPPTEINPQHYCYWESIGRSRLNGETTSGVQSLAQHCKDGTIMFYIKNKLANLGVIAVRQYTEVYKTHLNMTTLLTLSRFYTPDRSKLTTLVYKVYNLLKERPGHLAPAIKIRACFPFLERHRDYKRITMNSVFRSVFEIRHPTPDEISIIKAEYEAITEANSEQDPNYENSQAKKSKSKSKGKEDGGGDRLKTQTIIILRQPNKNLEELLQDKDDTRLINRDSDNEEEDECEVVSDDSDYEKHTFVDMPLREEIYRAICRHGRYGCSQTQLQKYLNMHYLTVRQILRGLLYSKVICRYCTDSGRQRIYMYVALEHGHNLESLSNFENLDSLKCTENPKFEMYDTIRIDIPEITAKIEHVNNSEYSRLRSFETLRDKIRKRTIIMALNQKLIISVAEAVVEVQKHEKENGYKDEICRKSLKRLIYQLQEEQIINYYCITLTLKGVDRIQTYITHPKLTETSDFMQQEIYRLKHAYYNQYEERRLREETIVKTQKQRVIRASLKETLKRNMLNRKLNRQLSKNAQKVRQQHLRGAASHKPPKFLISRCFHEFLYYLIVELSDCQFAKKITLNTLLCWQHAAPDLNVYQFFDELQTNKLDESVLLYNDIDLNWRTFIPPLPHYSDKPCGWIYIPDALERLPFSLFNKIFRLNKDANPQLTDFLNHPVRQYYLMRDLPLELQHCISRNYQHQIYAAILKLLNNMGLLQVHQLSGQTRDSMNLWVYFNRKVCIKDTTTSVESYQEVEQNREYELIHITLQSTADLNKYWTCLHRTCVYTKLGFRKNINSPRKKVSKKNKEIDFLQSVLFDEAPTFDNGEIPGNGLGAGGLDSYMFAHVFRNWSWVTTVSSSKGSSKKRVRHAWTPLVKNSKTPKSYYVKKPRVTAKKSSGTVANRKNEPRDLIDIDALKNMRTLRVKWSVREDQLLYVTRTVYVFLEPPVHILGLLHVGKMSRDIIRRCLGICNKTMQACVRRTQFLLKKNLHVPFVPTWLNMLQTNMGMLNMYGNGFLEKLQEQDSNKKNLRKIVELHFLHITLYLLQYILEGQQSNLSLNRQYNFLIPSDISTFYKKYKIRASKLKEQQMKEELMFSYSNPTNTAELEISQIINVLHSLLCCTKDKSLYGLQAFDIFKNYSEETLMEAFSKARSHALVIPITRRNLSMQPAQLAAPNYVLSNKYRMRLLFLKMPYGLYDGLYTFQQQTMEQINMMLKKPKSTTPSSTAQGANKKRKFNKNDINGDIHVSVKSMTSGQLFYTGEGLSSQVWRLGIALQSNMLTVDAEQGQNVNTYDRILSHHHCIFNHAPETHYDKILESDSIEGNKSRVKFNRANMSYKIHYSPWDYISKLPVYQMHFFCALDALYLDVEINVACQTESEGKINTTCSIACPFSLCIMEAQDYLAEINRIVDQRRSVIETIEDNQPTENMKLREQSVKVHIDANNILALIKSLSSIWQEELFCTERKDLGKVLLKPQDEEKDDKSLLWLQLCKDILTYTENYSHDSDANNDYEPTISKEDRALTRPQDVFVIKLPTLKLSPAVKTLKLLCKTEENEHTDIMSDYLAEMENLREKALMKILNESIWKYTENTFETLDHIWKSMKLNTMEQTHFKEIHDCIESKVFGVDIEELRNLFPYENFLIRSLDVLSENWLIKRVGVSSRIYVHKNHLKPWVVETFHVKRLEAESMPKNQPITTRKRTLENNQTDSENCPSKKSKNAETENCDTPTETSQGDTTAKKDIVQTTRDAIVMRPQPWMRLNGSLNRRVVDRWLGSILIECINKNGMSVLEVCNRFPHMVPVDMMFLLEILNDLKCIYMKEVRHLYNNMSLISEYETFSETTATAIYDPKRTYVYVTNDAITRMTNFIGSKKYNIEYI